MKVVFAIVTLLLFCITLPFTNTTSTEQTLNEAIKHLSRLLQNVEPNNDASNAKIRNQIVELLQNINATTTAETDERRSLSVFAIKVAFTKRALLYIKDHVKTEEGDHICTGCVKEPNINPLTNPFILVFKPNAWNETDYIISELLVDSAVSLKALKESEASNKYRNKLFCKAQRLFDGSEKENTIPEDPVDINELLTNLTDLLKSIDPKNETINQSVSKAISNHLKVLNPVVCEDGAAPVDNLRKVKKIYFCQKALIFLKDNITKIVARNTKIDCEDCVKQPDTRILLELLGEFTPETAEKMNDFIGKTLVDVAVGLKSLPDGEKYEEYKKTLDFNIGRLNLVW